MRLFCCCLLVSVENDFHKTKLSGTIVSACSSVSNLIIYLASNAEGMKTVAFWSMGSLASASGTNGLYQVLVSLITLFFPDAIPCFEYAFAGDEVASTLGVKLTFYRRFYMLLAALLTSIIVANSGMIGFVGLIIPHIVRGVSGSDHRLLMPLTALTGALFLIWADVIARSTLQGVELPIGIITALIGAPIFYLYHCQTAIQLWG